jgi:hypothetical protein
MLPLQPLEVVSGGRLDHRLSLPGRKPTSPVNLLGKNFTIKHSAIFSHSLVLYIKYAWRTEVNLMHVYS